MPLGRPRAGGQVLAATKVRSLSPGFSVRVRAADGTQPSPRCSEIPPSCGGAEAVRNPEPECVERYRRTSGRPADARRLRRYVLRLRFPLHLPQPATALFRTG